MVKLLLKTILFLVLLYIPLYIIQTVVDKGMTHYRKGEYGVWNDIYNSPINADLVIIGNSRAFVNISPMILDSALKQPAYNLGYDGGDFNLAYTRFKVYLCHNKMPKTVVLSISPPDLERGIGIFNLPQFMPFLKDTVLRKGLAGYANSFNKADFYVPAMKYRTDPSSYVTGIKLYFGKNVVEDELRVRGYEARPRKWDNSFNEFIALHQKFNHKIDTALLKQFKELIKTCADHHTKLYLVYSPEYIKVQPYFVNRAGIMSVYKVASLLYHVPFLDYSNDPMSSDTSYFYNSEHLNKNGSEVFTRKLAKDMAAN